MKSPASLARHLIVLALATVFLTNSMAFSAVAVRRPAKEKTQGNTHASKPLSPPSSAQPVRKDAATAGEAYGKLPMSFEINSGQSDPQVKFRARGSGYTLFLTATEAVLNLRQNALLSSRSSVSTSTLRMKLVDADPKAQITGEDQLPGSINYFTGHDAAKWRTGVVSYAKIRYQHIYPGVDMIYYGNQRELEYDFVVAPGASPEVIKLAFTGTQKARIAENGDLLLRTGAGEIRQHKPLAYQETGGIRKSVAARYVIKNEQIGFQLSPYDTSKPLTIDPILSYSTYLGGAGSYEVAFGVAVDAAGNAYVAGTTASADYPMTPGAFQSTIGGNNSDGDAFVTKLNAAGSGLVYSTYLGGSARDFAWDIAVDVDGNAYVTGDTSSSDFPTTAGAFQVAHAAGTEVDGFVVKLDPTGSSLVYSTYLGGSGNEDSRAVAVNALGEAYVTGETPSVDFPTTPGAYQTVIGSDNSNHDVFVTKLNATGTALAYSTFFGAGSATGKDIALDSAGNAYVGGVAYYLPSIFAFPVTANAQQSIAGAEGFDGFISELSATGADLLYSSYFGGSLEESVVGVAVDAANNVYVSGYTGSSDFPVTPGCAQAVLTGTAYDTFITKFDLASSPTASLIYSTYLGGSNLEDPHGIAVDSAGNAYVAGYTQSSDFPITDSLGATGFLNAFVARLNPTGSQFLYSTRLGDADTYGYGLAIDSAGNAYVVGQTTSTAFATTPGAFQAGLAGGGSDAFVAKIDPSSPPPATDMRVFAATDQTFVPSGGQVTFSFTAFNNGGYPATDVTISSQLPPGVTFNSIVDDGGGACTGTPGGASFSCAFPAVNPSESKTVSISFIATGTSYAVIEVPYGVDSSTIESFPDDNHQVAQFLIASPPLPTPTPGPVNEAQLAYLKFDPNVFPVQGDIFRRRADAAGLLNLTYDPAAYDDFAWSPDGSRIAFLRAGPSGNDANLYVMDADGANQVRLTNDPTERDAGVAWSPDGTHLAFIASHSGDNTTGVRTVNVDGSNLSTLTTTTENDSLMAWSPDGTRLSFTRSVFDFQTGSFAQSIHVMHANGSNQITFDNSGGQIDYYPAWSPDGMQIAFVRSPNDGLHGPDLFLAQRDGTNLRNLTNDYSLSSVDRPQWSPDGSKLSFLSTPNNGPYDLSVINVDGSGRTTLTGAVANIYSNKGWSPNGAQLVFTVSYGEVYNGIYLVNADGTGLVHIGEDIERNDNPAWSPDSSKLAFTSGRNSQGSIDIVNADGTNRVDLTNAPASYGPPKWRPMPSLNTPAGTNVTITVNGVALTFSNVTAPGQTTVTPIDPNSLSGVPGEYVINANSLAFEIHTTAVYAGPITIGFQVPGVNNPITFSALRVLHGEPPPVPNFVDRTVLAPDTPAPNFATRTVYARVTSLSPFIVLERRDPFPPVTTATLSAQPNAAGWHKANVTVTLAATDNAGGSGVQSLTYSATGAQTIAQTTFNGSTKAIAITTAGTTTITYRAKDVSGNVETAKTITVKLDKTVPGATTSTVNPAANSSGYSNGLSGPPTVTLAATDPGSGASGIAGFYVSATGAHTIPANTFVPIATPIVQITHDGTTTLSYRAVDSAGNEGSTGSRTLKVDATPPTTSYSVSSAGANITLTVNFQDNLSGYAAVNYSVDNGQWQTYTGPFPSSGSFSYTFNGPYHESGTYVIRYYGTDKAGNNETTKTATFTIPPQAITPTLASVTHNSNGTWTAKFGYRNDNPVTFNVAVGASNKFSPGNQNRGQTTAFQPGIVANAFTVTWDGSSLTWTIKGPDGQTRSVLAKKS